MKSMTENTVQVLRKVKGEIFYNSDLATALENCQANHDPIFMPELIDSRISSPKKPKYGKNGIQLQV